MANKKLALAKIARPRLHDVLARTRLFGVLDKAARRPVVWLCAQPGAGKTTLVASYLEARKRPGIWYQVDAADADPGAHAQAIRHGRRRWRLRRVMRDGFGHAASPRA